jgi:hypothetical protein
MNLCLRLLFLGNVTVPGLFPSFDVMRKIFMLRFSLCDLFQQFSLEDALDLCL